MLNKILKMKFIDNQIKNIKNKPLLYISIFLAIIAFFALVKFKSNSKNAESLSNNSNELSVFIQDGCIHCEHAEEFLNNNKFDNINVVYYNLKYNNSVNLLLKEISRLNIPKENLGTPIFVIGDKYIIGFGEEKKQELIDQINEKKN